MKRIVRYAAAFIMLGYCSYAQFINPPNKAVLDFYYLSKDGAFSGDVTGTASNMVVTNVTGINFEERFDAWQDEYGTNVVLFYEAISNAYYSRRICIPTNSPSDGDGVYWNAYDLQWYAQDPNYGNTTEVIAVTFTNMSIASNTFTYESGVLNINFKTNYIDGILEWNTIFNSMKFVCDFQQCGARRHTVAQTSLGGSCPFTIGELME